MHVRGHKAWNDDATGQIPHLFICVAFLKFRRLANGSDAVVLDKDGSIEDDVACGIYSDNNSIGEQHCVKSNDLERLRSGVD